MAKAYLFSIGFYHMYLLYNLTYKNIKINVHFYAKKTTTLPKRISMMFNKLGVEYLKWSKISTQRQKIYHTH